jgi:hypothetical protein
MHIVEAEELQPPYPDRAGYTVVAWGAYEPFGMYRHYAQMRELDSSKPTPS